LNSITAVILTFNESLHLQRCIDSVLPLTRDIVVVDSLSTDDTVEIAKRNGVTVLEKAWENNHSTQFNWALERLQKDKQWIFRIDADEVLTPVLVEEIKGAMLNLSPDVNGLSCCRHLVFQGHLLRFGGMSNNRVLRLFRFGFGYSEARWMDEHIAVTGKVKALSSAMVDDNLNSLTWWIAKHNNYASRAAVDALLRERILVDQVDAIEHPPSHAITWSMRMKEQVYGLLPAGLRGITFFIYRYILRLGFLDGSVGYTFYFLQTLWYRNLIDAKVAEVRRYAQKHQVSMRQAVEIVLGIALKGH
jgi:glycosyltransferase involved in cell wall biosynthesis